MDVKSWLCTDYSAFCDIMSCVRICSEYYFYDFKFVMRAGGGLDYRRNLSDEKALRNLVVFCS